MLFSYFERTDRFARAAGTFSEMLLTDPGNHKIVENGIAFYQRLLRKSDAALAAGNMSRDEVEKGLDKLLN
ncbi:MAG: hypothetical protein NVS3B14_00630 [Ktedonobacteraceae bacterium]